MPSNKKKRKGSAKSKKAKMKQATGLVTAYPKHSIFVGGFLVVLGMYFMIFESTSSANFGIAMLLIIIGAVTAFVAKIAAPRDKE